MDKPSFFRLEVSLGDRHTVVPDEPEIPLFELLERKLNNSKPLDSEIYQIVDENFWDLI